MTPETTNELAQARAERDEVLREFAEARREIEQLKAERDALKAAIESVKAIVPYCDIPSAAGMIRVVRLADIDAALAVPESTEEGGSDDD